MKRSFSFVADKVSNVTGRFKLPERRLPFQRERDLHGIEGHDRLYRHHRLIMVSCSVARVDGTYAFFIRAEWMVIDRGTGIIPAIGHWGEVC